MNGLVRGAAKEVFMSGEAFLGPIENCVKNGKGVHYLQDGTAIKSCEGGRWVHGVKKGAFKIVKADGSEEMVTY